MTVQEAYDKIVEYHKDEVLIECCLFDNLIGFVFGVDSSDEPFGGAYDCINKETGERLSFNPIDDLDLFDRGKIVLLSEIIKKHPR